MFPNGSMVVSTVGSKKLKFLDRIGVLTNTVDVDSLGEGSFVGFHFLTPETMAIAMWLGHDAISGLDAVEYDSLGNVIWIADYDSGSSVVEIIILDNLDPMLLHNEARGVMAPVGGPVIITSPKIRHYDPIRKLSSHLNRTAPFAGILVTDGMQKGYAINGRSVQLPGPHTK